MSEKISSLPEKDEALGDASKGGSTGGAGFDLEEFKNILEEASRERKSLQLLAEYFQNNIANLDGKKQFFEDVLAKAPDVDKKIDSLKSRMDEFAALEERTKDFTKVFSGAESNYNDLKRGLDELHLLSEHVEHKMKALKKQDSLVEKANEDAGRLNNLVWDMDSQIKQVKESQKLIKRTDDNVDRLENMLENVFEQVDAVVSFEKAMKEGEENVDYMQGLVKDIDKKLELIHKEKMDVESYSKDREKLFRLLDRANEDTEAILGQGQLMQEAQESIKSLAQEINFLKVEAKNIMSKAGIIRNVSSRLNALDGLLIEVDAKIKRIVEEKAVVDKTGEKLQSLNSFLHGNMDNKMKVLKEEMKVIDFANEQMRDFKEITEELAEKCGHFEEQLKKAELVRETIEKNEDLNQKSRKGMEEILSQRHLLEQVELKITDISSMALNLDVKMEMQLQRKSLIEKLEKKIDGLEFFIEEANLKVGKISKKIDYVEEVDAKFENLNVMAEELDKKILDMTKRKKIVDEQENRIAAQAEKLHAVEADAASKLDQLQEAKADLARLDHTCEKFRAEKEKILKIVDSFDEKIQVVTDTEKKIGELNSLMDDLIVRQHNLDDREELILHAEKKVDSLTTVIESVEERIKKIAAQDETLRQTQSAMSKLEAMLARVNSEKGRLDGEMENLDKTAANLEKLSTLNAQADSKVSSLEEKINLMASVETKLNGLNVLAEDVRIKIQTLKDEKEVIEQAGEQITELKFLLAEVDNKNKG